MRAIGYLEARLGERSFWGDIAIAVTAAAVLPKPWCYVFMVMSAIKALVPDKKGMGNAA
jgi:hypothetical protein